MAKYFITYGQSFKYYFKRLLRETHRHASLRLFALAVLCACLTPSTRGILWAQQDVITIESITFSGNNRFTAKSLLDYSDISLPGEYELTALSQKLQKILPLYHDNGFYFAQIDSVHIMNGKDEDHFALKIDLKEGAVFKLGTITITGVPPEEKTGLHEFIHSEGAVFNYAVIEKFINHINSFYANNGHPYISVNIEKTDIISSNTLKENIVNLNLVISKNKFVQIDSISVGGLEYSRPEVILRETRLHVGEAFKEEKIVKAIEYLQKLQFIENIKNPELFELENGKSMLSLSVRERKSNRFNGLIGYVPAGVYSKGYYIGTFLMDFGNVLGTGRKFQAEWQKLDKTSQKLRIFYEEPWIMGMPVNVHGQFEQSLQDSSYIKRSFTLGLHYRLSSAATVHASAGSEQVIAEPAGRAAFNLHNTHGSFYAVGLSYNKLDYALNPRKGIFYSTYVTRNNRTLSDDIKTDETLQVTDKKINAQFELALPVEDRLVAYTKAVWNQITSSEKKIPVSQQWYLGGARSLRGYREKQFLASKVAWFNLELRYILMRDSRVFLFWDGGFFQNKGAQMQKKFGYGFGFRIDSRVGMIGFDFGLGENDTFSTAKLHFRLQNTF